jgi:hypothetical protein
MTEATEDPREDENLGEDPLARSGGSQRSEETGTSKDGDQPAEFEKFVEEMESDPARAGTDSPAQDLLGG